MPTKRKRVTRNKKPKRRQYLSARAAGKALSRSVRGVGRIEAKLIKRGGKGLARSAKGVGRGEAKLLAKAFPTRKR